MPSKISAFEDLGGQKFRSELLLFLKEDALKSEKEGIGVP